MKEEKVSITTEDGLLSGLFAAGTSASAVICHPHPLYGGSMDNNVVIAARDACRDLSFGTLRFNFRGVGSSTGVHDGEAEVEDVRAAVRFMQQPVHLIGYSFGAYIALALAQSLPSPLEIASLTLISLPTAVRDVSGLSLPKEVPSLLIAGARDNFCDLSILRKLSEDLITMKFVDHFYCGHEGSLKENLRSFLSPCQTT